MRYFVMIWDYNINLLKTTLSNAKYLWILYTYLESLYLRHLCVTPETKSRSII